MTNLQMNFDEMSCSVPCFDLWSLSNLYFHCIPFSLPSLVASLLREGIYSTIRLGAYEPLKRALGATDPNNTPLWKKICAGAISGNST